MRRIVSLLTAAALTATMMVASLPARAEGDKCTQLGTELQDAQFLYGKQSEEVVGLLTQAIQQDCLQDETVLSSACPLVQDLTTDVEDDPAVVNALTVACKEVARQ